MPLQKNVSNTSKTRAVKPFNEKKGVQTVELGLLGYLHKARITGQYDRKFAKLVKVSLLIIDDYGLYPMTSPQDEDFHELVAHRYEQRSTIITSNLEFGEWDQAFARNKLLATATLDRLLHNAYRLTLQGKSYRKPRDVKKTDVARG